MCVSICIQAALGSGGWGQAQLCPTTTTSKEAAAGGARRLAADAAPCRPAHLAGSAKTPVSRSPGAESAHPGRGTAPARQRPAER